MTDINDTTSPAEPPKKKGWPKGKPRGVRQAPASAAPVREQLREGVEYTAAGRVMVRVNGEELTRKRTTSSDIFHIPPEIIPHGWDYQFNVLEVTGQPQTASMIAMAENGWRPVPAGRHSGMFMPADYSPSGPIIRDGLRLEERPMVLTEEAKQEEAQKANRLVRDQQEQLGLTQKMPNGFSRENADLRRAERAGTSRRIAPASDIPRPQLPIDPNA